MHESSADGPVGLAGCYSGGKGLAATLLSPSYGRHPRLSYEDKILVAAA